MKNQEDLISDKWLWKMNYCRTYNYPPGNEWCWNQAEKVYNQEINEKNERLVLLKREN